MRLTGVYVHFPFCLKKCHYCSFHSTDRWNKELEVLYIEKLHQEISSRLGALKGKRYTLYFGGGTPTAVDLDLLLRTIEKIIKTTEKEPIEFTVEANPETLDKNKLKILKAWGVNRISIGVQSFNDEILKYLGRIHNSSSARSAIYSAREVFHRVNIDLIFGIPIQHPQDFEKDLLKAIKSDVEHISVYGLTIEPGSRFFKQNIKTDEDRWAEMFKLAQDILSSSNYTQYEISNYTRERICIHNMLYWKVREYIGLGANAVSFIERKRFKNPAISDYIAGRKGNIIEILSETDIEVEKLIMGLRTLKGVKKKEINSILQKNAKKLGYLKRENLILEDQHFIRINPDHLVISNHIISQLL